jgi:uracil-DNA glycosylase
MHLVEALFASMSDVAPYPPGVVALPARLPGVGFFPGGAGLWDVGVGVPLPPMPCGGVMVLGRDFHSEAAFEHSLRVGTEVAHNPTWRNLLIVLKDAGIEPGACFFTNAYMGLRRGAKATGPFPGEKDSAFVQRCSAFFRLQLRAQAPRLILALGKHVPAFLARLSPDLHAWQAAKTFRDLDAAGPVAQRVSFPGVAIAPCSVVALIHPSYRPRNVGLRRYKGLEGGEAELEMLREALRHCRMSVV